MLRKAFWLRIVVSSPPFGSLPQLTVTYLYKLVHGPQGVGNIRVQSRDTWSKEGKESTEKVDIGGVF